MIVPASLMPPAAPKPGRHRYKEGFPILGPYLRIGGTPDEFTVEAILGLHGRTVESVDGGPDE